MNRFFTSDIVDNKAFLAESDAYHLKNVLRAKAGDKFEICNGIDKEYIAVLTYIDKKSAELDITEEVTQNREPKHNYILCQCIPKCRKIDDVIRHATELGMSKFYPVISERVITKNSDSTERTDRLQRIADEAAKQSKRIRIPVINDAIAFADLVKSAPQNAIKIIAWEEEKSLSLYDAMNAVGQDHESVYIMVGPEGGLTADEVNSAKEYGWISVTLGKRILRTETAPLVLLSAVSYHLRDLE